MSGNNGNNGDLKLLEFKAPEKKKPGPKGPSKYTPEFIKELAGKMLDYVATSPLPLACEFACNTNTDEHLYKEWSEDHEEFSASYKKLMQKQKTALIKTGVAGKGSAACIIFVLKNNHKMKDRFEFEHDAGDLLKKIAKKAADVAAEKKSRIALYADKN